MKGALAWQLRSAIADAVMRKDRTVLLDVFTVLDKERGEAEEAQKQAEKERQEMEEAEVNHQ